MTDPGGIKWMYPALALACALLVVAAAGFAMQATDQAAFCGSCHVMREAALTHKQSVHAKLACNECHAPAGLGSKIPFKAATGSADIAANLAKHYSEVIHAQKNHKDVVNANCIRCHEATVAQAAMDMKPYCAECHRQVPHKAATPISTRKVADG
jgi:cytochrome c nitrite reductase small subunit